ncbi:MAG: riboflavin biosynthesis protein RibF [Nitrospirota bacterium]
MKVFWKIPTQFEYKDVGLTIGVFDGVHCGHQKIITGLVDSCRKKGMTSLVFTFEVHPRKILLPPPAKVGSDSIHSLTTLNQKIDILANLGVEVVIITDFEQEIMNLEAREFVENVLVDKLKMRQMWIGTNYLFGKNRLGDIKLLQELSREKRFKLHIVEPVEFEDELISSTRIRKYLKQGDVRAANLLLGRHYTIVGTVIHGVKRGRILGYPTANIKWDEEILLPKEGVYAVQVKFDDEDYNGIANLGYRPTFRDNTSEGKDTEEQKSRRAEGYQPTFRGNTSGEVLLRDKKELMFEVHILDFNEEIYFKELNISFVRRIRDEMRFKDSDSLIEQLKEDEKQGRELLINNY